jgi:hypothetical protein
LQSKLVPEAFMLLRVGCLLTIFLSTMVCAQTQSKYFHDPATDVDFRYPAEWKLDSSLGDYIPVSILNVPGVRKAVAKVGVQGIGNTALTSVQFVYAFAMTPNEERCHNLGSVAEESSNKAIVIINGARYEKTSNGGSSAGHSADQIVYATFREGRCYLFDEFIASAGTLIEEGARRVSKATYAQIERQLEEVMQSVTIGAGTGIKIYSDLETGVSFQYPSAWTAEMGNGYGGDPLKEERGKDDASLPKERFRAGWAQAGEEEDESWPVTEVSFAYALLPEKTEKACASRFANWNGEGDEKPGTVRQMIHGLPFWVQSYSEAGLGHSWSFDLYTTFRHGRCLGFSVGSNFSRVDERPSVSKVAESVPSDPDEVFKSLRIK